MGQRHAERLLVEGECSLEVLGGDADVIDPAEHGRWSLRSRKWIALGPLAVGLLLDSENLPQGGDADLELLGGRLLGGDQALDLVPGAVEGAGAQRSGVALAPGEHLGGQRGTRDADGGPGDGPWLLERPLEEELAG